MQRVNQGESVLSTVEHRSR